MSLQQNTIDIINSLPASKLKDAYNYLLYLKDKEEWEATQELLTFNIIKEIQDGIDQINSGDFVELTEIRRNV